MSTLPNQPNPEYRVQVRAVGAEGPPAVRLRRWLKVGLRAFGLRCVSAVEVPHKEKKPTEGAV